MTPARAHALRVLWALAATALDVIDLRAAAGVDETDDRPRLWLLTLQRWTLGEATPAELSTATLAVLDWRNVAEKIGESAWTWAIYCLRDARADLARHPSHVGRHVARTGQALVEATPGDDAETRVRVTVIYADHLRTAERRWVEATAAARLRQAREDCRAAELALGTVRETWTRDEEEP